MLKFKNSCTVGEINRYEEAYLATWDTVNDAILYTELKANDQTISPSEKLNLTLDLTLLKAELRALEAKRQGFRAGRKSINSPNSSRVSEARQLAEDSDEVIRQDQEVVQIISLATEALILFNKIQGV